jgi:hypothetical protein
MTAVGAYVMLAHLDIVRFLQGYTAVYACGAVASLVLMIRGPFQLAYKPTPMPQVVPH